MQAEMVNKKSKLKLKKPHDNNTLDPPTTNYIFKTLISALESHEGIKSQLLKSTYYLLVQLSSKQQLSVGKGGDQNELFMKTNEGEVRLSLRDLCRLSNTLFKDLEKRLKQLHDVSLQLEEVNLLIRCCVITLTMAFHLPQKHFLESGRAFLLIFKKLSLLQVADMKNSHSSCQCMCIGENSSDSFAEVASLHLFHPCIPSITTILEVFIDELLVHGRVRKYLHLIHSLSPANQCLFKHGPNSADFGILMEMIFAHFSLSISNEGYLEEFLNKITWAQSDDSHKSLGLSITAARILLQNPVFLSSPNLLQAHIVSLVSNVINLDIVTEMPSQLIHHYLPLFESSVTMYTRHMSKLKTENHSAKTSGILVILHTETSQPSFESCIEPTKRAKLDETITALNYSWNLNLRREFFKKKLDLLGSCTEYIDETAPHVLDIACRDEVISFLKCMLMRAANDDNDIQHPLNSDASLQDICLLASLLMLMSNSLIQSIWCLKNQQHPMEYDFILGIIKCFKEFSIRLPIQKFSYNIMESCNESRLMLIHFLGLLSLGFDSGLDFLVKSCISVIMALTNLFVYEEGNIDAVKILADPRCLSSQTETSLTIYEKPLVVAAKFQKIRALYVSSSAYASNDSTPTQGLDPDSIEETCSGEMYLKTRLLGSGNVTDFDDLADFVECKKGKDYVGWLKDRDKFRKRKITKRVKRMWDKKKQAWRSMRGKA
ncbi:hypothetical protein Lser_V15G19150 [Lactuca serriola]